MDTAKQATGKTDDLEAVVEMRKSPAAIAAVEQSVAAKLDELAPILDRVHSISKDEWQAEEDSRSAAFARLQGDPVHSGQIQTLLLRSSLFLLCGAVVFIGALIAWQMWLNKGQEPNGQLMILFGMLVTMAANVYRTIADWGFGSSKQSGAKDIIIGELSKRRQN